MNLSIAATSDWHGRWQDPEKVQIPHVDVLVVAGDILGNYSNDHHLDAMVQLTELERINLWFGQMLKNKLVRRIVAIAGNHDWIFQLNERAARATLSNATYLCDEEIVIDGVRFYGTPWTPEFCDWAFMYPRDSVRTQTIVDRIPSSTHVLVTHGPPKGILDSSPGFCEGVGCRHLMERIKKIPTLRLHVFGHIHGGFGIVDAFGCTTQIANVSAVNEQYEIVNKPVVFQVTV